MVQLFHLRIHKATPAMDIKPTMINKLKASKMFTEVSRLDSDDFFFTSVGHGGTQFCHHGFLLQSIFPRCI